VKLVDNFDHGYNYVTNVGRTFYFTTNADGAFKKKVVSVKLPEPGSDLETAPDKLKAELVWKVSEIDKW